jgi:hypothetical protein
MGSTIVGLTVYLVASFAATSAWAACRISNQTGYSFVVTSGNTSNQSLGAHTTTTIASGKILGKSKEGKTIGGSCKDGDDLVVKEEQGVPLILPK